MGRNIGENALMTRIQFSEGSSQCSVIFPFQYMGVISIVIVKSSQVIKIQVKEKREMETRSEKKLRSRPKPKIMMTDPR